MRIRYLAAALAGLLLPTGGAQAEPQILALLSSDGAMPLVCDNGECSAEFSAFCMEPGRAGPPHESPYSLAPGGELTLIARLADGSERRIDARRHARFLSQRGYGAVRIAVPARLLAEQGAESLAIEVGPRVALLPVPLARHHRPHEPEQVAAALGPNRVIGDELVDRGGERADAARLLDRVINALPARGEAPLATRERAWKQALAEAPERIRRQGRGIAEETFEACGDKVAADTRFTFRHCLQRGHDHTLWFLNHGYWKAVGPQS